MKDDVPQKLPSRAVFVGCARDCARSLGYTLENVSNIAKMFVESAFIFVENDSRDLTKLLLQAWCREASNARAISLDGLAAGIPQRTIRLERARNEYLRIVRAEYQGFDYMIVVDCDEAGAGQVTPDAMTRALGFLERDAGAAAVFGNSSGAYYDMWALRHRDLCPTDIWEELSDLVGESGCSDQEAYDKVFAPRIFAIDRAAEPIAVESAFGGFGIYKIQSVLRNRRSYVGSKQKGDAGWQVCEHVSFNRGFRENEESLYILPYLVNCTTEAVESVRFPPSAWRGLAFDLP